MLISIPKSLIFRALKPFGIKDYVKLQGFMTECGQDTAISGKYLRRLVEIILPFTEGAMKSLMESFISKCRDKGEALHFVSYLPIFISVEEGCDLISFKNFMKSCPNLPARALYNVVTGFGMPVMVKHLALRLSR